MTTFVLDTSVSQFSLLAIHMVEDGLAVLKKTAASVP